MQLTDEQIAQFNSYYTKGSQKMKGLILLDQYSPSSIGFFKKIQLNSAIKYFEKALLICPDHWQSLLFIGKLYQRVSKYEKALYFFEQALKYEDKNPNLPQEASLVAMHLGQIEKAVELSKEATKRAPDHCAILGNHSMNLLIAGFDKEAKETIDYALSVHPDDKINQLIKTKIDNVISGKIRRPTFKEVIG